MKTREAVFKESGVVNSQDLSYSITTLEIRFFVQALR